MPLTPTDATVDGLNLFPQVAIMMAIRIVIACLNLDRVKIVSVVVVLIRCVTVLRLVVIRGAAVVTLVVTMDKNVKVVYARARDVTSGLSSLKLAFFMVRRNLEIPPTEE